MENVEQITDNFGLTIEQLYERGKKANRVGETVKRDEMSKFYSITRKHYDSFPNPRGGADIPAGFSYDIISERGALRVTTTEDDYFRAIKLFNSPIPTTEYGKYLTIVVRDGSRTENGKTETWTTFRFSCTYNPIEEQAE